MTESKSKPGTPEKIREDEEREFWRKKLANPPAGAKAAKAANDK